MLQVNITGAKELQKQLGAFGRQVPFAAAGALNDTAFAVNADIKREMRQNFRGGATPFSLRAFRVRKADKRVLEATVMLRTDESGGTNTTRTLGHLFTGGQRRWKRLEGLIRAKTDMPDNMMAVPGDAVTLDMRGNIIRRHIAEIVTALRNRLQTVNRAKGGGVTATGYFTLTRQHGKLPPGLYRRVTRGGWVDRDTKATSVAQPLMVFVRRGFWRRRISLQEVADQQGRHIVARFNAALRKAMETAR